MTWFDEDPDEDADTEMAWKLFRWLDDQPTEEEIRLALVRQLSRRYRISAERAIPSVVILPPPTQVYRYDLGLHLSDGTLIGLIEVKRDWNRRSRGAGQTKAYRDSGLPWRYCRGPEELAETVRWAMELHARWARRLTRQARKPKKVKDK